MTPDEKIRRIEKALARAHGTHTWDDVRDDLVTGKARIFDGEHGCWITKVIEDPQKRWLSAWLVAGELPHVMDLQEEVERWGLSQGCAFMGAVVRPGWKNVYPKYGWKRDALAITKELIP
jgi:GNAT superfamily N-acetyltransferase